MKNTVKYQTIDEYLDLLPRDLKNKLQILRSTIQEAAPGSTEVICYQMPTFKLNGNLLHFAAYKSHIGFYPGSSAIQAFIDELAPYNLSKGTIRFTLEDEIPLNLIFRIVKFRVEQNKSKLKAS